VYPQITQIFADIKKRKAPGAALDASGCRGMGILPMSFFLLPASEADGRTHGRDARAT
jgi:hypothetical protein